MIINSYDLFGLALKDYVKGERYKLLIERDDGYSNHMNLDLYFSRYEEWPDYEKCVLEHVRGRVLDVGCGAGRHSLYLQDKGFDVVSIDLSLEVVKVAKDMGCLNVIVMDARFLGFRYGSFNTILLLGNNFGIAGDVEDTVSMLRQLHDIGRDDTLVVTTCRDPTKTDNPAHLSYHERNRRLGLPIGLLKLRFKYKNMIGSWFKLLIVTPGEMRDICEKASWNLQVIIEGENGMYSAILTRKGIDGPAGI